MIGGLGKDTIKGGAGNDLLIGGTLANENQLAALDAALAQRTSHSTVKPSFLGSITDDGDKDDLSGEKGIDRLVAGLGDKLKQ